jgi:hypothetical protein
MRIGRNTDAGFDMEEALLKIAKRDPTLWHILRDLIKRLDFFNLKLWVLIALGVSNSKWVDKGLELVQGAPAAAATLLHHLGR